MKIPGKKNTNGQVNLNNLVITEDMNEQQVKEIRELLKQKRELLEQEEARLNQKREELKLCAVKRQELDLEREKGRRRKKKRKKLLIAAVALMLLVNGAGVAYGEWGHYQYRKEAAKERESTLLENEGLKNKAATLQEEIIKLHKQ